MQKKRIILAWCLAALLIAGIPAKQFFTGAKPLKGLSAGEITDVRVGLYPPDAEVVLVQAEIEELVPLLNEVVTYRRDDSFRDYCGQAVVFTLTGADGVRTTVQAYNPFVIIDGIGWRTKYGPCEALNRFGNELLRD